MNLGEFSVSLSVKDLQASKAFYQQLGFEVIHGQEEQHWLMLQNGKAIIGLFQGMFEGNILTFNPTDARGIRRSLKKQGVPIIQEADESTTGPTHLSLKDPDGNAILIDQHVD